MTNYVLPAAAVVVVVGEVVELVGRLALERTRHRVGRTERVRGVRVGGVVQVVEGVAVGQRPRPGATWCRDAKRLAKKSAKPFKSTNLTNQRPATKILTNGITWREIHFEFWTNQRTIRFLLASLSLCITKYGN